MQPLSFESITVDEIDLPVLHEKKVTCSILRLDKIHPIISGNKWFKLKYYLEAARKSGKNCLVTFGGAYSNHIIATAAAGDIFSLKTIGIIRGEKPKELSFTLQQAIDHGMTLIFAGREGYRNKKVPEQIEKQEEVFVINEGGYGTNGVKGASEILSYCAKENYSHVACAVGTSTMMAGLIRASHSTQQVVGIPVLRNNIDLEKALNELLSPEQQGKRFKMIHDYHFGGYAKCNSELIDFMNEFYKSTSIPTDFVYTAKLIYGILDMVKHNHFPGGSNLLLIHSGGLQGNRSLPKGSLIF